MPCTLSALSDSLPRPKPSAITVTHSVPNAMSAVFTVSRSFLSSFAPAYFATMTAQPPFAPSAKASRMFMTTVALPIASTARAPSLAKLPTTRRSTKE